MKAFFTMAAALGLAFTPVVAAAAQSTGDGKAVGFSEALACSSLFSTLGGVADDPTDEDDLLAFAARWLVIAMDRKGIGPEEAEKELLASVTDLIAELEAQDSDAAREELLLQGIDVCDARYEQIADEFDSIDLE